MADPAAAGFRDVTRPCLGGSCEGALFWDPIHPTTLAHARLAAAALPVLATVPSAEARP
jgi:outer membrane lipase/esterase